MVILVNYLLIYLFFSQQPKIIPSLIGDFNSFAAKFLPEDATCQTFMLVKFNF